MGCSCSLPRPFKPLSHIEALTRYYESFVFAVPVIDESRVHEITDGSFPCHLRLRITRFSEKLAIGLDYQSAGCADLIYRAVGVRRFGEQIGRVL